MGFTYFRSVSCFVKLDPNFSICITQLQTIINVYYARLTTVKGVTKTGILCAVIEHNAHVERICKHVSNTTKVGKNKTKIHDLFGFYSTRK